MNADKVAKNSRVHIDLSAVLAKEAFTDMLLKAVRRLRRPLNSSCPSTQQKEYKMSECAPHVKTFFCKLLLSVKCIGI